MPYLHGGLTSIRQLKVLPLATVSFGQEITLPVKDNIIKVSVFQQKLHFIFKTLIMYKVSQKIFPAIYVILVFINIIL